MSVRSKIDGGKFYNRIQSGSFQHRCAAAALRLQLGPGWVAELWKRRFGQPTLYSCNLHKRESENLSWTVPGKSLKSIKGDALRQGELVAHSKMQAMGLSFLKQLINY